MIKLSEIPILLLLVFTLVYSTIGDPSNKIWSGSYFFVNYLIMFLLFKTQKSKINRIAGMSLSVSILIFILVKYFTELNMERYFNFVTFITVLIVLYKKEKKCT